MLTLLAESFSIKLAVAVVLAGACAFLYLRIQRRKKELENKLLNKTADEMLEEIRVKHFADDDEGFQEFVSSKCEKNCAPECEGGVCVASAEKKEEKKEDKKEEEEETLPAPALKPPAKEKKTRKPRAKKVKKSEQKVVLQLD